jgi:hypothetical protein
LYRIENADRIGDVWVDADRDLKGPERDRRTGDGDRFFQVFGQATD